MFLLAYSDTLRAETYILFKYRTLSCREIFIDYDEAIFICCSLLVKVRVGTGACSVAKSVSIVLGQKCVTIVVR
jgi:hypothetical protein